MNKINLIVARSSNNVIGKDNTLIWQLSSDLKRFKQLTTNNSIIMGRKTYESIGRPLPNRKNIILSRQKNLDIPCIIVDNLNKAIKEANIGEVFIIGGSQIYRNFLEMDIVDTIYLTQIHHEFEGDAYFEFDESKFEITEKIDHNENNLDFSYITYRRKS